MGGNASKWDDTESLAASLIQSGSWLPLLMVALTQASTTRCCKSQRFLLVIYLERLLMAALTQVAVNHSDSEH